MKKIGLTQRVEVIADYGERRDCLDQAWQELLWPMGLLPVPLSNMVDASDAHAYLSQLDLDGVILTGGNDLAVTNGSNLAPERDAFESFVLDWADQHGIPVLGVCRGMQMIHHHFGGQLHPVTGHVAKDQLIKTHNGENYQVNSYHNWGILPESVLPEFKPVAWAEDGTIEHMVHREKPVTAMMWHPERTHVDQKCSQSIIQEVLL